MPGTSKQAKLSRTESSIYATLWIIAVFYSIYCFYSSPETQFINYVDTYNDFKPGWSFLNRKIDVSDEEWRLWIPLIYKLIPWIIVHIFISQYLKYLCSDTAVIYIWYILISILFLWNYFGLLSTLCTLLLPCISCLLTSLQSKSLSWLIHSITLVIINWAKVSDVIFMEWLLLTAEHHYILTTAICWIQLRSISYSIDSIGMYKHIDTCGFFKDLLKNIAYCLYLPTLFLGPVILYQQFTDGIDKPFTAWNKTKIITTVYNVMRYSFWILFTNICLHYLYFNALLFHGHIVAELSPWAFYGLGYCMGQYFLNKYVVVYGVVSIVCKAEDIEAPVQPKCIGRIHLYSDMWKHFDRGLYKFLLKYIYIPCNPKSSYGKFFASALCFAFIFLWHGLNFPIFIWAFLNFLGLLLENIVKSTSAYFFEKILHNSLSPQNKRRLECILISPLLAFSAIANFYFLAGDQIGNMYIWRIIKDSWQINFILLFILYCCCQTCIEIKQIEQMNSLKSRKDIEIKMYKKLSNF
ncbi:PREDICTED: protein-cysteine N-palmitoyltransferase Rasp [Ceratosolen solmsi marchali]|uniref:Protein-cysteine N-palmitoyltransferase Rasp n=1 Tax=Ceratosolen solmsi marchali TaxID=326594 RepID=A0AAJ7E1A1_9HYME|nr:PREDICTED: protein-cysteine N-palmitoyltransferase Rasp [Ceratosolen solmsi marchali]